MSVYTDLLQAGITEESAREIDAAVRITNADLVTKRDLAEFEARFNRRLLTTLVALTGIYAGLLAAMAGVIVWAIERTLPR